MPKNIQQIKNEGKETIETTLDVKVIHKFSDKAYVIGDESGNALLESCQDLEENVVYKILKPKYLNDKFHDNPKFKILKTKLNLKTKAVTKEELKNYRELTNTLPETQRSEKVELNNFNKCEALDEKDKIDRLTLLIVSKSGDIEGKYGSYHIVTAKDCEGQKNSLSIYHDKTRMVKPETLLTFTNLKKLSFKPTDSDFNRLATNWNTRIFEAKDQEKEEFSNVLLGDEKTTGNILGYENFNIYNSCKKCFSKLLDNYCKKCKKEVGNDAANDFYVTLYVQDVDDEENIMSIFAFKHDLKMDTNETEEFEKALDDLTGKTYIIEYNKTEDEERLKLVKLHKD